MKCKIDTKKVSESYPVVLCDDGLYRYERVSGGINLSARGYKSAAAAAAKRNALQNIPFADDYMVK